MNIEKEIQKLLHSNITGYQIWKATGVAESVISKLRSGERSVGNLTVQTAQKLLDFKEKRF